MTTCRKKIPTNETLRLFHRAADRCSKCRADVVEPERDSQLMKRVSEMAHVIAHSPKGPRGDANESIDFLDTYENLILLCPTCHKIVDTYPERYPVQSLKDMKKAHEAWVEKQLCVHSQTLVFSELDVAAKAIAGGHHCMGISDESPSFININQKISKNSFNQSTRSLISGALGRAEEVKRYLACAEMSDPGFPKRLVNGFKNEYISLKQQYQGDELFENLIGYFHQQLPNDFKTRSAVLVILSYLFSICEIFEK